jgi:ATP-dependent RNA helicase RhlE
MTSTTFAELGLAEKLLLALDAQHFTTPTPIQVAAIPPMLAGRDLLGIAQTGTGKTAAFGLPLLQHLSASPVRPAPFHTRALILAPTRELALQIEDSLRQLGAGLRLRSVTILGGVSRTKQVANMRGGADIVVGTPGRICDLMATRELRLGTATHFVLDEADRMLDLGFIRDIRRIAAALPHPRQSSLFSATMPAEIAHLADSMLRDPVRVSIAPVTATIPRIEQSVHFVHQAGKRPLLGQLLADAAMSRVLVFTRTKRGADRVADDLERDGVSVEAIHGNKSQPAREKALDRFRSGRARVLVATDIAARGIDVTGVSHVVNYDLPVEPESYVHRIGRTARAGAAGIAISFCDAAEHGALRAIEKTTGKPITVAGGSPPARDVIAAAARGAGKPPAEVKKFAPGGRSRRGRGGAGWSGGAGRSGRMRTAA